MRVPLFAAILLLAAYTFPTPPGVVAQTPNPCSVFSCPTMTREPNSTSPPDDAGGRLPLPDWFADWFAAILLWLFFWGGTLYLAHKYTWNAWVKRRFGRGRTGK